MDKEQTEKTTEVIQRAEKNFALVLPLLVDETARDVKKLNAISTIQTGRNDIFYLYRPYRSHLTTRFGVLFYIMTRSSFPKLWGHQFLRCYTMVTPQQKKWTRRQRHSGGQECIARYKKNQKYALVAELQVRTLKRKYRETQEIWIFKKFFSDNGPPRTIRTDNGSCFKSKDFKEFCIGEIIKRS